MSTILKQGSEVSIDAISIGYDEKNGEYEIEITDATLLSLDLKSKRIRIKMHSNKLTSIRHDNPPNDDHKVEHYMSQPITEDNDDEQSDVTEPEEAEMGDMSHAKEEDQDDEDDMKSTQNINNHVQQEPKQNHINTPQKQTQSDTIEGVVEGFPFIPKDQQEIIEMSDENDEPNKEEPPPIPELTPPPMDSIIQPMIHAMGITLADGSDDTHHGVDEYASDDDNDRFQDDEDDNERSIKIEHNLRDPYLDEILTKQINAALQIDCEDEKNDAQHETADASNSNNKNDWRWALHPDNIASEWSKHAPSIKLQNISSMTKSLTYAVTTAMGYRSQTCSFDISECECVQRLIFIIKYYSFWMKFKSETRDDAQDDATSEYAATVSDLIDSLKAYNRSKLLRDYLHIRHYHFNDDKLIAYIHRSQIPDCNDNHKMCTCIARNDQNKEIYKHMEHDQRRALYWIEGEEIAGQSEAEMLEINLQNRLDVIHSSLLHNAISNGDKFVTSLHLNEEENKKMIVDAPYYEFGIKFDFHNKSAQYCAPKYPNLKTELLNNPHHKLSRNDFALICLESSAYMECDEGCKAMRSVRSVFGMIHGTRISMEHVIVLLIRCNYAELQNKFDMNRWMQRHRKDNERSALAEKTGDIAHWNKMLIECVVCFADLLDESQYIYHGINCKISFRDLDGVQFNNAISCTTQYSVARHFAHEYGDGICLKLSRMQLSKGRNYMLEVSDLSDYPNEREVLIFGDKLHFVDIVYDSLSHHDYVLSLQLYQQIIGGRWLFAHDYHNKKHQRRIVKMIENMMNTYDHVEATDEYDELDLGLNYIDPYIQALFESITKNVLKKTIWINKESDALLPELKSVFINAFIPFLKRKPFHIESKYAHVDTWTVQKKHLLMTDRGHALKSAPFDHVEILNNEECDTTDDDNDKIEPISLKEFKRRQQMQLQPTDLKVTFGFRCYRKYDAVRKEEMFKGEFMVQDLPPQIESVKMLGGLWFPQIPLSKWDWCSFSNKKKAKGSSLFAISQIVDDKELKLKICYQVKEVIQKVSLP
eukprot:425136_1